MTDRPAVQAKICGLTRRSDAEAAAAAGAAFLGVVLAPGGRRTVSPAMAAELLSGLPPKRAGIFVNASAAEVLHAADVAKLDVLQLHGDEEPEYIGTLRSHGSWTIWKAVRPRSASELADALSRYADSADGLLLDGWSPDARGGTGTRFPWEAIAELRHTVPAGLSLVIAGGLHPGNVGRAVELLRPDVVDVSSGVEAAPGVKDAESIQTFMNALRQSAVRSDRHASHV